MQFVLSCTSIHDDTKGRELRFELSRASTPMREGPGAAIRALPRLGDTTARSCNSCSPMPRRYNGRSCASCSPTPRRYNGWEMQFVLSYASTIQWPELRLVLSCASTPMREGPGAAIRALPCLDARRDKGQGLRSSTPAPRRMTRPRPGAALRALPHLDAARTTRQSR
ncbi:hypothetical protein B0H13DRAFT_2365232 [Mycena leptocephala]|nr:hypothetical protein B0H13DRAFT_2365232 [Mycena leptocephala]